MTTTLLNSRYQIIQLLGAGGFGETFLAEDTYMPSRRRCVIKQLKPMTDDPQMYELIQQRFEREAATLEFLGEGIDQIPKLYAYFTENGHFYLVQEWIQGQTLSSKVESVGPLSPTTVRDILISLLQVLNYVHSQGIIYRDIKPENIMIRESNGKPVLIDFGAVKETLATVANQGKSTHTIVIGTPGFMAPEQATGRPLYASDIYSLGMTAICLLTGKLPQELETDSHTEQVLWQEYAPNVSPHLAAVLNKAIQYHPRDRYTTAIRMLDDLQAVTSVPPRAGATAVTRIVAPTQRKTSRNWHKNVMLGSWLAGGLLSASLVVSLNGNQSPQSSIVTSPSPQSNPEQPIAKSPPAAAESPKPVSEAAEVPPKPVTVESSAPPPASALKQDNENQNDSADKAVSKSAVSNSVPGFPIGTSESRVEATLGNPTKTFKGFWPNTQAAMYEIKPNQITLGYLFDRNSRRLRQTEVSFGQSVPPQVMQSTLQGMLGDRTFINISQGLQQVYQRRTNKYSFNVGQLKGVIERNERDRIYIGVWQADLH